MSLYKGNTATEGGSSWGPGAYKFKVSEASVADWGVLYSLKTWTEDGSEGPNIKDALRIHSPSDAVKQEIDRRLTTMLGKPEIDSEGDLVGKAGWVVLRKGPKYLEPMPFGGYYKADKTSATGKADSILKTIEDAKAYDWKEDSYAVEKAKKQGVSVDSSDDDGTEPF